MINPFEVKTHKDKLKKELEDKYLHILQKNNGVIEEYVDSRLLIDGIVTLTDLINTTRIFPKNITVSVWQPEYQMQLENAYIKLGEFSRCLANYIKDKYTKFGWIYGEQLDKNNMPTLVVLYV